MLVAAPAPCVPSGGSGRQFTTGRCRTARRAGRATPRSAESIIDKRKIRGLRAEINAREQRLQQAYDKQELVANQVKILRDAVMQEYAKLNKAKKMSLEQEATDLVSVAYKANRAARSSLSTLSIANNALGATMAPTGETDTRAPLLLNIAEEFE